VTAPADLDAVKADLPGLLAALGLEKPGNHLPCRFCGNRDALSVHHTESGWRFRCHRCEAAGSIIDAVALGEGLAAGTAIRQLAGTVNEVQGDQLAPIRIGRAMEQLRQERAVFDLRKEQDSRWFALRLAMARLSVVLLPVFMIICSVVLFQSSALPEFNVKAAGAALFADVLGLLVGVWKIVLKPDFLTKLSAVTTEELPETKPQFDDRALQPAGGPHKPEA